MFKTNEYFDGNVKSIAFKSDKGPATIGAMKPGEYVFGTSTVEYMTVTSGQMEVQLPKEEQWKTYHQFETFMVNKDTSFKVKVKTDTSYLCIYK